MSIDRHEQKILENQQSITEHNLSLHNSAMKGLGSIYTPPEIADYLTSWAIQHKNQKILDVGVGRGVFTFSAYRKLLNLGAKPEDAQLQMYGTEKHEPTYKEFLKASDQSEVKFHHVYQGDFFNRVFPEVEAVVGNPPYVRRQYIEHVDRIRQSVTSSESTTKLKLSRLTDLYIYFLIRAFSFLKIGGRLAVITADPWLNVVYGQEFKKYLQEHFEIENVVSFDRPIFEVEVKPVLLLATKKRKVSTKQMVNFVRVKNGLPVGILRQPFTRPKRLEDVDVLSVLQRNLQFKQPWSTYFKAQELIETIASHELMTPLSNLATTRLGIQTLAKEFFVLTLKEAHLHGIESGFLEPLAHSTRSVKEPVIEPGTEPAFYLFYCSKADWELKGTNALKYIKQGEKAKVSVRGKNKTVTGYHNKERIQNDRRPHWYNLQSSVERRGRATILIPRLVYRDFMVVWNKAEFIPGELFIEFIPTLSSTPLFPSTPSIDTEVYLAVLSSSVAEVMIRLQAQVYGGGTYNIAPGQIKNTPILNVVKLTNLQKDNLKRAYLGYVSDERHDKAIIDRVIYEVLGLDGNMQNKLRDLLTDMYLLAKVTRGK